MFQERGRYAAAEAHYRRALDIAEAALGADHPRVASILNNLASLDHALGRYRPAESGYRRGLAIAETAFGADNVALAAPLNNLASLYDDLGRYAEAERLYLRALAIAEKSLGAAHPNVAAALNNLAVLMITLGRYDRAEALYRRALAIVEKAFGADHAQVAVTLGNLAGLQARAGRYGEAERLYRRALAIERAARGPDHPSVAATVNNLAALYSQRNRFAEAEQGFKNALEIWERAFGPDHPNVAAALGNLGELYQFLGRGAEAAPLFRRALAILEAALGADHAQVGVARNNLAGVYLGQDRLDAAEAHYRKALAILEAAFGPDHPEVAVALGNLADLRARQGRYEAAIGPARRATEIHRRRLARASGRPVRGVDSERRRIRPHFHLHLRIVEALMAQHPARRRALLAEGFEVAQLARGSAASGALARMAARFAARGDDLAAVVRQHQDALDRWRNLDARLVAAAGLAPAARHPEHEAALGAERGRLDRRLTALDRRLATEYPDYAEIARPRPLALAEVQRLLRPEEAMIAYTVAADRITLHVVRRDRATMRSLPLEFADLRDDIGLLRAVLEPGGVTDVAALLARGFDGQLAHGLYRTLLAPASPLIDDARHLLVVADGPLTSLPFSALLTAAPRRRFADFADYRSAPWLLRDHAVSLLPAVSSLGALRRLAKATRAERPFIGFGDPLLAGTPGAVARTDPASLFRGARADVAALRRLPRLPETAVELRAIAAALGAGDGSLFLGAAATERRVRAAELSDARVAAFATHGLLSGEVGNLAEPALVLTPPDQASDGDNGLLTAGEIARHLRLDADWVILSACNTAAGEAPGADGLSGLAKAFFYAGARALLVSHWPVQSEAAVRLTTGMFAAAVRQPGIGGSEALRRSMRALMRNGDRPEFAHPMFWAPFVVVGEGARATLQR